jgi:AcrR family transcriptional regulator
VSTKAVQVAKQVDHEQILAGARRAIEMRGAQTTLEDIAEQVGISRVTLYRRGATRESILSELADRATEEYRRALWPSLTGRGRALDRLEQALSALTDAAEANLSLLVVIQSSTEDSDAVFNDPSNGADGEIVTRHVFTDPLERLISDGQEDGSVRDGDPSDLAAALFTMVGLGYRHLRFEHRWSAERARETVVSVAVSGLGRP